MFLYIEIFVFGQALSLKTDFNQAKRGAYTFSFCNQALEPSLEGSRLVSLWM